LAAKIPVTIITGFLGSGKTTLVRHLLENNQDKRLAVIVNEFGELGIDGELLKSCDSTCPDSNVLELTNGCLCCTVQEEFLPTILQLIERRHEIDHILIETSGLALPKPLVTAFRWPEIRHAVTVDGVLTVVDCAAVAVGTFAADAEAVAAQRAEDPNLEHETPLEELFEDQLGCADLIVLNKTDLVESVQLEQVTAAIRAELPRPVKLIDSQYGRLPQSLLLGMQSAVEEQLDSRPSHHDFEEDHDHDDRIQAVQLQLDIPVEPQTLKQMLETLLAEYEIYRVKGFAHVAAKPMRWVVQGVGQRIDGFYDRPWRPHEVRRTQLVAIGRDLPEAEILDRFQTAQSVVSGV
jgi:cobalamin biosynthesis protein CobW